MKIDRLDHLVLTVRDIEVSLAFYRTVLGMEEVVFGEGRRGLAFGCQKINLHQLGNEFEPRAANVRQGSADLCFIIKQTVLEAMKHLEVHGVEVIEGPVVRTGAIGKIISAYFRDPDGNLIEISNYVDELRWR